MSIGSINQETDQILSNKTIAIFTAYAHKLPKSRPELLEQLLKFDNKVIVMGLEEQSLGDHEFAPLNIKYYQIPLSRHGLSIIQEINGVKLISKCLKDNDVDVLLTYGIRLILSANYAAKKIQVRVVNIINGAGNLFSSDSIRGKLLRNAIFPILKHAFGLSEKVIFQNKDDLEEFIKLKLLDYKKCALTNGSGVNLSEYTPCSLPADNIFAIDCRLSKEKGIWELLQAFEKLKTQIPDVQLRIAGKMDGLTNRKTEEEFNRMIAANKVDYIGEISNVREFLSSCRFFVYPSYYREGVPRSIIEAMACARPIITTDMPGCRETIVKNENGYLVTPKSIDDLYNAMYKMCIIGDKAKEMGYNSRRIAEEKFDVHSNNKIVLQMLTQAYYMND